MAIQILNDLATLLEQRTKINANFAELNATKYAKPVPGIPFSDLTTAVQTSLEKADESVQPVGISNPALLRLPSGVAYLNASDNSRTVTVSGGTVSQVAIATESSPAVYVDQGSVAGAFTLPAGFQIKITWSVRPVIQLT